MTVFLASERHAHAWVSFVNGTRPGFSGGSSVDVDAAGNVFVAGTIANGGGLDAGIFKLSGFAEVWRHTIDGGGGSLDQASQVLVDADGDAIVTGLVKTAANTLQHGLVAKLAGDTGVEIWRVTFDGGGPTFDLVNAAAIDSNGDVIAAGSFSRALGRTAAIVKLSGDTGAELWRLELPASGQLDSANGLAVLPGNDVLVAGAHAGNFQTWRLDAATGVPVWALPFAAGLAVGVAYNPTAQTADFTGQFAGLNTPNFAVLRLDAATGAYQWFYIPFSTVPAPDNVGSWILPATDGTGDLFACGRIRTAGGAVDHFAARVSTAGAELWTRTIDGSAHMNDYPSEARVDASGSPVIAGAIREIGTDADAVAIQLDPVSGAPTWATRLDGTNHGFDGGDGLGLDAAGNPLLVGALDNGVAGYHLFAARLRPSDGAVLERFETKGDGFGSNDSAAAVTIAPDGDVVLGGETLNASSGTLVFRGDFTVARLDGRRGGERWRYVLPGVDTFTGVRAVAADATGNVFAAGSAAGVLGDVDATLVKLGPAGDFVWLRQFSGIVPGSTEDTALALAVGADGSAFVTGALARTDTTQDFFVAKLHADGVEAWRQVYQSTDAGFGTAVAVDGTGDVVAAGHRNGDGFVVKLAGTNGVERWTKAVAGPAAGFELLEDAVLDPATGDVLVTGNLVNPGGSDLGIVRLAGGDGGELWRATFDGPAQESDLGIAIAVAPDGDVVATGRMNSTTDALFVVRLGPDKTFRWSSTLSESKTTPGGIAVDAAGNVAVVATSDGNVANTGRDLLVLNLDGASGAERWRHRRNGTVIASDDAGAAIVVDAVGGIVAAGAIENPATIRDMAIVRLSPDGDDVACLDVTAADPECQPCDAGCDDTEPCTSDTCGADTFCVWTQVDGDAATTCGLDRSLDVPQCSGLRVPRGIAKKFKRAGKLVRRGLASDSAKKQQRLLGRGSKLLGRALALVDKAEHRRRRPLAAECAAALRALIQDAKARVDARLAS